MRKVPKSSARTSSCGGGRCGLAAASPKAMCFRRCTWSATIRQAEWNMGNKVRFRTLKITRPRSQLKQGVRPLQVPGCDLQSSPLQRCRGVGADKDFEDQEQSS